LVIDDEDAVLRALSIAMTRFGFEVICAPDAQTGLELAAVRSPDLVILDLTLPDMTGIEWLRLVRGWSLVPVIVLSASDARPDKLLALDAGADDYVTKPFDIEELAARIRAVLRRSAEMVAALPVLTFGELEVDLRRNLVRRAGKRVHMTRTEWKLLEAFVANPGKLLTHEWLLRRVWGPSYGVETNYVRVYVRQLRQKLGDSATAPRYIVSEPGLGYRWLPERGHAARPA
jgi:two-component system KDP operon response regulator KdpE